MGRRRLPSLLRLPLQVWLPERLHPDDAALACRFQAGEARVVLDPSVNDVMTGAIEEEGYWFAELRIGSPRPGSVNVYHINRNGSCWGPGSATLFPDSRIDETWLHRWLRLETGAPWPADLRRFLFGRKPSRPERQMLADVQQVARCEDPQMALVAASNMSAFSISTGYALYGYAVLAPNWVEKGGAQTWSDLESEPFRFPTDPDLQWKLKPEPATKTDRAAVYGRRLAQLSPELRMRIRQDPSLARWLDVVPVRRCWGLPGLLWALVIERLEQQRPFTFCRCGMPLPPPRTRCTRQDNLACAMEYERERTRRSRSNRQRRQRQRSGTGELQ
jgi:hypothetical protein